MIHASSSSLAASWGVLANTLPYYYCPTCGGSVRSCRVVSACSIVAREARGALRSEIRCCVAQNALSYGAAVVGLRGLGWFQEGIVWRCYRGLLECFRSLRASELDFKVKGLRRIDRLGILH
jgi:hypothetical protein